MKRDQKNGLNLRREPDFTPFWTDVLVLDSLYIYNVSVI